MNTTNNTAGTTNTAGHGPGLMGKIKSALDPNVNTTAGATTDVNQGYGNTAGGNTGTGAGYGNTATTGHTGHSHAHTGHQDHVGRDAALAGGGVGVVQHERNEHHGGTAAGTGGTGGTGMGAKIKNALDPNVDSNGNPKTGSGAGYGNTATGATTTGTHHHHTGRDAALAGGAAGVAAHEHNKHHPVGGTTGTGAGTTGAGYGNSTSGGYGNSTGAGAGMGAGGGTSNINPSNSHAGTTNFKGKLQEAVGSVTGSQGMQAKGLANQEQAQAEKFQTGELSEAQRLEQTAQLRRDRAVASGAHPGHRTAGGGL